jgi:hypothetical protein
MHIGSCRTALFCSCCSAGSLVIVDGTRRKAADKCNVLPQITMRRKRAA